VRKEEIKKIVSKKYEGTEEKIIDLAKIKKCSTPKQSHKLKMYKLFEMEEAAKYDFNKKFFNEPLDYNAYPSNIKFNEAAIIREEFLIKKKEKEEEERLNKIIIEKKDSAEYERWKREMEKRDEVIRMEEINKRKIKLQLANEEAALAYKKRLMSNKKQALEHKIEEAKKLKEKQEQFIVEVEEKKKLVHEIRKEEMENYKEKKGKANKRK